MSLGRLPPSLRAGSRRELLLGLGGGFGSIVLADLLAREARAAEPNDRGAAKPAVPVALPTRPSPMAPKPPHHEAAADAVIYLFMDGGPSHIDLFDPKPALAKLAGQPLPASYGRVDTAMGTGRNSLLPSKRRWSRNSKSGAPYSDWVPNLGKMLDEVTVVRSMVADGINHSTAISQMNTGELLAGRPSLGAWVTYGLGSVNQNLPGFVVLCDDHRSPPGGAKNWGSGFMPSLYQGTRFQDGPAPIIDLLAPRDMPPERQRRKLDLLGKLNREHLVGREEDDRLEARLASFELAFRMQAEAPEAIDLSKEPARIREMYGLNNPRTAKNARNCLLARRLVERGVRFVQVYFGSGCRWDAHEDIEGNHGARCPEMDQPAAALIADLKRLGLLDRTLVIWGGEFGRTPMSELGKGRDHNPWGFTTILAGAGVRKGHVLGSTDELGLRAVEKPVHVHDFHATILDRLGLDHFSLTFNDRGRDQRLTVDAGELVKDLVE
jgi:hypothetical protein